MRLAGQQQEAAATKRPKPQTAARPFKPPFWKLESEIKPDGNPDCPQALVRFSLNCRYHTHFLRSARGGHH